MNTATLIGRHQWVSNEYKVTAHIVTRFTAGRIQQAACGADLDMTEHTRLSSIRDWKDDTALCAKCVRTVAPDHPAAATHNRTIGSLTGNTA